MVFGIVELYQGSSGKMGYYNSQEIGLAKAMEKLGYETVIFYPDSTIYEAKEEKVDLSIRIVLCPAKNIGVHSKYDWNILIKYNVDFIQIGSDNQLFTPDLIRFCDKKNIPVCCSIGTIQSNTATGIKRQMMKCIYARQIRAYKNHKCFAKTASIKIQLEAKGVEKVEIAPVGLDITVIPQMEKTREQLRRENGISENTTVLLFIGRMEEDKSPFETISLMKKFKGKDVLAIVIGTGSLEHKFNQKILEEGLEKQIKRINKISNTEIHKYYKMADYYLNYTSVEIFGMSILEAMYQGCTVIANHAPGPDFIIQDGISGYLVEDINQMEDIIKNKKHLSQDAVIDRILQCFLWDNTAKKIHNWIIDQKMH